MRDQSEAQRLASLQQRLESLVASLPNTTAPAALPAPRVRAPKPIALTLRLDPARYARLSAHAARYAPRRAFQAIITEALDMYLA